MGVCDKSEKAFVTYDFLDLGIVIFLVNWNSVNFVNTFVALINRLRTFLGSDVLLVS